MFYNVIECGIKEVIMQDIIKILVQDYYLTIKMYGLYFTPGLLMMRILGDFYFGKK